MSLAVPTSTKQVREPFTLVTGYRLTTDPTYLLVLYRTGDLPSVPSVL